MRRRRWLELQPWKPFFWDKDILPTGIYLKAEGKPATLPSGHEVDEELFYSIQLELSYEELYLWSKPPPEQAIGILFPKYVYRIDLKKHTRRSVRREGCWGCGSCLATSPSEAIKILKNFMHFFEMLAFEQHVTQDSLEPALIKLVAWEERLGILVPERNGESRNGQSSANILKDGRKTESARGKNTNKEKGGRS